MRKFENWEELDKNNEVVEFEEHEKLPAGPQIVQINYVKDIAEKEYLEIGVDIVDGVFKGEAKRLIEAFGKYPSQFILRKSYKQKADKFFRAFITAVEKSNVKTKYVWDWNEQSLVGKYFVAVFGEEEYLASDGTVKVAIKIQSERSIEALRKGDVKTPELKKLKNKPEAPASPFSAIPDNTDIDSSDLPF